MLDRVEDDLFDLAEKARATAIRRTSTSTRARRRASKRSTIESAFRRQFLDFFNRKVQGDAAPARAQTPPRRLALVDDEELEEALAVREHGHASSRPPARASSWRCRQRMGFLLEKPELDDDAQPDEPRDGLRAR